MVYPPGQGQSGEYLMQLWREYLEEYAGREDNVENQIVAASYHAVDVLAFLSKTLDRNEKYRELIGQRTSYFREARERAQDFLDCLVTATFSLYNTINTLSHQFTEGNEQAAALIRQIDEQVRLRVQSAGQIERSAAALRASFPLLSLITIVLDKNQAMTQSIRKVEQRFAAGSSRASTDWEHIVNALYRVVEVMQIFVTLSDFGLRDQVNLIALRFQEEDQAKELRFKLRNGFCRLFELGHLLATHVDC